MCINFDLVVKCYSPLMTLFINAHDDDDDLMMGFFFNYVKSLPG